MCDKQSDGNSVCPKIMNLNANKAGMSGLDSDAINRVIHEWSNGSNFHSFQTKRQQRIDDDINQMKKRLKQMTEWQRNQCLKESDIVSKNIEKSRDLSRIIVHMDLDMFFAAVEIKHRPELADKPIAVGSEQMLATSNYVARKFGVRPGMPGVLAKRLCPQLILIRHSFGSYSKESKEVMKIISEFDPNFCCMSLDECYIDLTDYTIELYSNQNIDFDRNILKESTELPDFLWDFAAQIVSNIRQRVLSETQLSASAGIASNSMIAKVCSDVNKPNGQHMVRGNPKEIEEFLVTTPVRKICGIGPVRTQYLTALDINTCKDLWHKRDIIRFAFTPFNADYYLRVGLGIGSSLVLKDEEPRKSISSEQTVGQISNFEAICELLKQLSEELVSELNEKNQSCRTITIKLKKITFETTIKSQTIPYFTSDSETILNVAKKLLETELSNTAVESRKYRLIGLKVSNLKEGSEKSVNTSQMTLSQIFTTIAKTNDKSENKSNKTDVNIEEMCETSRPDEGQSHKYLQNTIYDSDFFECSVCMETFSDKSMFEDHENDCIGQMLSSSLADSLPIDEDNCPQIESSFDSNTDSLKDCSETSGVMCPICSIHMIVRDNNELNSHIDMCLNKDKCKELTQVPNTSNQSTPDSKAPKRSFSDSKLINNNNRNIGSNKKPKTKSQKTIDFFFSSQ